MRLNFARTALSVLGTPEKTNEKIQNTLQEENIHQEDWLFFKNANENSKDLQDILEEEKGLGK